MGTTIGNSGKIVIEPHKALVHIGCIDDLHGASTFMYVAQVDRLIQQLQEAKVAILAEYPDLADDYAEDEL